MDRWDRPALDNRRQRPALTAVELRHLARRLAVNQSLRSVGIETQHPISDHLKPDTADPRRIRAPPAVTNLGQREKPAALCRILRRLGQSS